MNKTDEKIEELEQKLEELKAERAKEKESKREPRPLDVYEATGWKGTLLKTNGELAIDLDNGFAQLGVDNRKLSTRDYEFRGRFHEVYVTRDQIREELKEKFMKMRDLDGDLISEGPNEGYYEELEPDYFIDNLFDGKNCDGSEVQ
jgi:hypothetical protein